jgi:NAD(P)-dependent dehydrogenase (short-subunit alcohol dehydrogenase family)
MRCAGNIPSRSGRSPSISRNAAQRVAQTCGDVDILVNNAGDVPSGSLETVDEERWRAG